MADGEYRQGIYSSWAPFTIHTLITNWGGEYLYSSTRIDGEYDGVGVYQKPEREKKRSFGSIVPITNLQWLGFDPLAYASQDRILITSHEHSLGEEVFVGEQKYIIRERISFSQFDTYKVNIFTLKTQERSDRKFGAYN